MSKSRSNFTDGHVETRNQTERLARNSLEIRYPEDRVLLEEKIDKLYNKYERVPSEKDDRTLRFKAVHIDTEELERLLKEDPEIEHITGSAEQTLKDEYPSSR